MANSLQKTPLTVYTPAVPAVPGLAPYCVSRTVVSSASGSTIIGEDYQPVGQIPQGWDGITDPNGYGTSYSPFRPVEHTVTECFPGTPGKPAVPSRIDQSDHVGWNGGARSIAQIPEAGFFTCTLPGSPIGVQVGFGGRQFTANYSAMKHSIVARRENFSIVESGSTVFGPDDLPPGTTVTIQRLGGVVTYLVDGIEVYQSEVASAGEVYGSALLYSVVDFVDAPQIESLEVPVMFSATLPALVAGISEDGDINRVQADMPLMQLAAQLDLVSGAAYFSAQLPALAVAISETGGLNRVVADIPALRLNANLGLAEEMPSSMIAVLPPPVLSALAMAGSSISFAAELPPLIGAIGDIAFNRVQVDMPIRLITRIVEPYLPADTADGSDAAYLEETSVLESALLLMAFDSLDVNSTEATLVIVLELASIDGLNISDATSLGSIIELIAMEQVAVLSRSDTAQQQALQYAVNFMTGALTTYEDFDFLGFTYDNGDSYAWRKDGLYRLGGKQAEGEVVRALVDFGASDYGDAHLKRIAAAYVGVRTDGECYVKTTAADGIERVYKLQGNGDQKRATLAKGVNSRYWNVRLELVDATYAGVDNIELEIGVSQRRGYERRG